MTTPKDSAAAAKARHPAGKAFVPKASILNRLLVVVREHYWVYGTTEQHMERWDVRSMLDYAVLTHEKAAKPLSFGVFYCHRDTAMGCLINSLNDIRAKGTDMINNYGDWRYWETDGNRTQQHIERVILHALDFEVRAELDAKKS